MRRRLTAVAAVSAVAALGASEAVLAHDGGIGHGGALKLFAGGAHAKLTGTPMVDALGPVVNPAANVEHVAGRNDFTGGHVAVEGKRLYVGSYGVGMRIFDISDPAKPRRIGGFEPGLRADAPPDAAVFNGRHIAVLNGTRRTSTHMAAPEGIRTDRTEFFDATDPAEPIRLHTAGPDQTDGESHNGDIVDKRRLYLPSGGTGHNGLRIYDLSPMLAKDAGQCNGAPRPSTPNPCAPDKLYGSKLSTTTDPVGEGDPTKLWSASPHRGNKPVGPAFTHTHDIEVYTDHPVRQPDGTTKLRDIALLAEGGAYADPNGNTGSMFVIDITDPRKPVVLLRWLHATGPGHHPIRYHHEAQLLDGDRSVVLVTDEDLHNGCGSAGGVAALRLSPELTSATELSEWFIPLGTPAPVCSVHVFSSKGNTVYFGSYNAGLQVVDYADPEYPKQVGHFIAPGATAWGALYHKGYVYVGDVSRGLDVFQYDGDKPKKPKKPKQSRTRVARGR